MRIAILGDFHMHPDHLDYTAQAMEDISRIEPDLVVPLGDFGSNELIGTIDGLKQAYDWLSAINAPLRPILGNHDLQRESGNGPQKKGTIEQAFRHLYRLPSSCGVLEYEHFRLFFLSTEAIPEDECYHIQECYTADQYDWVVKKLAERPGVPCIFFSHAPPVGCGLQTVPEVHVRTTNAYLDHNHNPTKWFELYRTYPEIVLWFSAHYHLGHRHPLSMTERFGTRFFLTGVHGAPTRDGDRQSRVLDIADNRVAVRTLDHRLRKLLPAPDWFYEHSIRRLPEHSGSEAAGMAAQRMPNLKRTHTIPVGVPGSEISAIIPVNDRQCLLQNGRYLWEADLYTGTVMGSLQNAESLYHVIPAIQDGKYLWIASHSVLTRIDLASPFRFIRHYYGEKEELAHTRWVIGVNIDAAAYVPAWKQKIWIASGGRLYTWDIELEQLSLVRPEAADFNGFVAGLAARESHLRIMTKDNALWRYDAMTNTAERLIENETSRPTTSRIPDFTSYGYSLVHIDERFAAARIYAIVPAADGRSQPVLHIWEKTEV